MADYNGIDTGSEVILDPINGRVADGVRLGDVKTLAEIQSASSFLNSEVASASAVKEIYNQNGEWVDISADFMSHITNVSQGAVSSILAMRKGNIVMLTVVASNVNNVSAVNDLLTCRVSKYTPKYASYGVGMQAKNTMQVLVVTDDPTPNANIFMRIWVGNYSPSNGTVRASVIYYTEDF